MEANKKLYESYVKQITPVHNKWLNLLWAFLIGGLICTLGQGILNMLMARGLDKDTAAGWETLILIGLSVLATGMNLYPKLVKFAGAGALVPITGFANSVAAPATEFKVEGNVFGTGCKIFTIAGPVILYGIFTSWLLGIIYLIWQKFAV
ncbi:SpoVA/SpoVAEb family sporulation membrane protein [Lachnoclostridium edouardi]|uniref:SpoVA/SpoVAEb family sporulation membrane protein n=1 Tax=Lachnoclostridium edouardi TaxID=1926283 RepID=UPI000C7B4958|nr:SpoVA/SpoVAEb family sporulation membrane protein [Lachnoclostridium edouardi]